MVKLNNPLMGTETRFRQNRNRRTHFHIVKLNNPLMGTETFYYDKEMNPLICSDR